MVNGGNFSSRRNGEIYDLCIWCVKSFHGLLRSTWLTPCSNQILRVRMDVREFCCYYAVLLCLFSIVGSKLFLNCSARIENVLYFIKCLHFVWRNTVISTVSVRILCIWNVKFNKKTKPKTWKMRKVNEFSCVFVSVCVKQAKQN